MLVIGAKGFAKEILEIIYQNDLNENLTFYDDVSDDLPEKLFGKFPIIRNLKSTIKYFKEVDNRFVLGIGNPKLRYTMAEKFKHLNGELTTIISPFARIGHFGNLLGKGLNILSNVVIETNNKIGEGCLIHNASFISHDIQVGSFCEISPSVNLLGEVHIGDFCKIGTGAIILPKIKLGKNVIVGAGSVVTKDIPDNSMVIGVPAKIVKSLEPIQL